MVGTGDIPANDGTEAGQPPNLPTPSSAANVFSVLTSGDAARRPHSLAAVRLVGPLAGLRCIIERRQHLLSMRTKIIRASSPRSSYYSRPRGGV